MAQTSIQKIDRTSKVAREFRKLALFVSYDLGMTLPNNVNLDELEIGNE